MARPKSTFEKMQREKSKREKKQKKLEEKKSREKDTSILDFENMTAEEFRLQYQKEQEELANS